MKLKEVDICINSAFQRYLMFDNVTDMNECEKSGMCPNGECINMDGSYKCRCNRGYKQSPNQQVCLGNV